MNIKEIGEALKKERERQGLTLEDVFHKIKISPSSLKYIEEGRIDELPHPVYTKGFIKNYAHLLGLDAEELGRLFSQNLSAEEDLLEEEKQDIPLKTNGTNKLWIVSSVVLTVVFLCILGWLIYDVFIKSDFISNSSETKKSGSIANTSLNISSTREANFQGLEDSENNKEGNIAQNQKKKEPLAEQNETQKVEEDTDLGKSKQQKLVSESKKNMRQFAEETSKNAVSNASMSSAESRDQQVEREEEEDVLTESNRHVLEISASEACWLSADIDKRGKDLYLRPGESITFHFQNKLDLKLGNAGGVSLEYDGRPYSLKAESGEVKTLNFP